MENLSDAYQEFEDVWPSLLCAVVFLLLLLWDLSVALHRRAHWAPGQCLVLTALTIQMLSLISSMSDISYVGSKQERDEQVADLVKKHQLLFDCGRLMVCVFLGYLLPVMVRSNWTNAWSTVGGLILTVLFRLAYEVYFVWRMHDRRQSLWFAVSNTTLFTASLVLSLLLSSLILAGKSIRSILSGKVHWALSCCSPYPYRGECRNPCCTSSDYTPSHYSGECKNPCCSKSDFPYRGECKNPCCISTEESGRTPSRPYRGECQNPCCFPPPYCGECKNPCCSPSDDTLSPYSGECRNPCCSKSDFPYRGECKNPCCTSTEESRETYSRHYSGVCQNPCCSTSISPYCRERKNLPCYSTSDSRGECKNSCCSDTTGPCNNWCCSQYPEKCETTEVHVLKCWIVARVSQPEYIMARSVFSSLAGVVVTIAVVVLVVKWACYPVPLKYGVAHMITVFIECTFILVGWIVVSQRWLSGVYYFPRKEEFLHYTEDFWTKSIVELQADLDAQLTCRLYKEKIIKQRNTVQRVLFYLITAVRLHTVLLPMRVWLQIFMVSLSKACWGLSQSLVKIIRPFIVSIQRRLVYCSHSGREEIQFEFLKYRKALELIRMPGEIAFNLWTANEMAFKKTQGALEQGIKKGEVNIAKFTKLESPSKSYSIDDKFYREISKKSWKRRGVALMYCMIHFYEESTNIQMIIDAIRDNIIDMRIKDHVVKAYMKAKVINYALEACSEAWDLLDFVDSSKDMGADKEFDTLVNMWHKHYGNLKEVKRAIKKLEKVEQRGETQQNWLGSLENWHGSQDWMSLTMQCHLYKRLYKKFQSNEKPQDGDNAIKELQNILARVIRDCIGSEVRKILIEKCNKWAEDGKEQEISHAVFIAGKAKGLQDKIQIHEEDFRAKKNANGPSEKSHEDEVRENAQIAKDDARSSMSPDMKRG